MPRIPTSKSLAAPPAGAGLIDPRSAGGPFAAVAEGLDKIGDELFAISKQQIADARQVEYAQGQSDIMGVFYEERLKAEEDPDIDGMPKRFSDATYAGVQGVLSGIKDGKVHALLSARAETIAHQQMFAVGKRKIERRADKAVSMLPEQTRTLLNAYSIAESPEEREEIDLQASNLWRGEPHLTAVQQEAGFLQYKRTRDSEGAASLLENSPQVLMGMSDEQVAKLYPTFDSIERDSLVAKAKLKVGADTISNIEIGIGRSTSNHELDTLERQTESLFKSDLITPPKRTGVIKAIDRQRAAIAQDINLTAIFNAGMNGVPLDPNDPNVKKAIDFGLRNELANATTPKEARAVEFNVIESTHILPPATRSRLNAIGNSNDADAIATETQSWEEYKDLAPQIVDQVTGVDARARVMFDNVAQDIRAGLSAAESVERTREVLKIDKATTELRKTEYDAVQRDETNREWLQENLGDFGFWKGGAEVPDTIAGPFSANVERHFMLDPNIERARRRATEDLDRVVGQNNVGSRQSVMPYPPVKMYKQFGADDDERTDAINAQLNEDVLRLYDQIPTHLQKNVTDRIVIMSDLQTPRERSSITAIHPETGDEVIIADQWTPGYQIHLTNDDDELEPFINPDTGEAHRFYPQFSQTEAGASYRAGIEELQQVEAKNRELNAMRALDRNIEIILSENPVTGEFGLPGKNF